MKNNIKELKQRALNGDLSALEELRQLGVLSGNKSKYSMFPVSYSQRRLWFIDKMDHSPAYNLPAAILFEGNLNVEALENAFKEIVKRHEILRTVFIETDGTPYQKIYAEIDFKLDYSDLSNSANIEEKTAALIEEESNRQFDLAKGPLLVSRLFKTENEKHLLLFNMHHIISDGWSIGVLISELTLFYNSFCQGETNPLEPLKIQYRDYVQRHNQILKEENPAIHRNYWLQRFSGELPVSELTPDLRRPLHKTFSGKLHEICLEKDHLDKIEKLCRQNGTSHFMFLLSVVNILIYKYTGKSDIIVGSAISGREQRDLENQIGFYVNTIPLRNEVESDSSFNYFLGRVKSNCIEAYDHQIYPFDLLIEDLNLKRDTSRNPLFEITVSLQESDSGIFRFEGIRTSVLNSEISFSKFDLHFNFEESPDALKLGIIYNSDLYTEGKIQRISLHFRELLQNLIDSPEDSISSIEIISEREKEQILMEFNSTSCPYPKEKTIAELFQEIVETYPDKPAVVYQGRPMTYSQLDKKTDYLAFRLKNEHGLKIEEPVVILMDRSDELVVTILGVLKAGGAYLPLDTNMPDERIAMILKDVNSRLIIVSDKKIEIGSLPSSEIITITDEYYLSDSGFDRVKVEKSSSNLAYILYTSGSTGIPKGSMIEEKSILKLVRNSTCCNVTENSRILSTSSFSFDATTFDLWASLLNGATLFIENSDDYLDPDKLKSYISTYGITNIVLSTGLFLRIAESDQQLDINIFEGVDEIIVGGDRLPFIASNKFIKKYPETILVNGYGPTENTTFTTFFFVDREYQTDIPIGRPISNTTVYIFDEYCNLCPIGVPGEIYIGGEGLSRGYVNRPDLNERYFLRNPLNDKEALYRSGDMAQWREDGTILFLGRNDDQIKIRGYRIETGEIENIAAQFPEVTSVKIVVIQEEDQKELALYYTALKEIGRDELRNGLIRKLPEYMIPKYFIQLDKFPLNQNGKVEWKAFPKPEITISQAEKNVASKTQTAKILLKIFENILNVNNISGDDNFFSLGGHSLKAIKAVSAIHKELSVKISLKEFFTYPSISSLEEIIQGKKRETLGIIPAIKEAELYALSHAQKRLWVLDKIEKSKSTYNIPLAISFEDQIDYDALQFAFTELIQKHEALRTVFVEHDGEPYQKILSDLFVPIEIKDFSFDGDPDKSAFDYVVTEAHKSFALSESPLIRMYIIKTAANKFILMINIHHIICDGWSLNLIIDELFGGYKYHLTHQEKLQVIPKIQYKEYAYWLNDRINSHADDSDRSYWINKLSGEIPSLDIPTDYRRPVVKSYQGKSVYFTFPNDLKKNLDAFNIEKRCSLFMTLVAAIKVLIYKYSGQEDIIIGTPVAGRDHPDLEDQIGYYVNTLALRDRLNPERTFAEFLEEVKKTATDAYSHQMYPFDKLVEDIKLPRDTSRSPLFDVMLVLQNFDIAFREVFKKTESFTIPMDISKFDLTFNFNDTGTNLEMLIEYNTQLFRQERIEQIASHLIELLNTIISNPVQKVRSINIISKEERNNLLHKFNDTAAGYPTEKTIVQLFEEAASKYSSNTAVVYKDKSLTYSELNNRSNRIAACLKEKYELSIGEPVGVLIAPTEETAAVLLAILKAGGAYVPIDPEYPDERISHILSESKIQIIIANEENAIRLQKIIAVVNPDCQVFNLIDAHETNEKSYPNPIEVNCSIDTTAYIIFTSGSTGKPKGCPISHRNLIRLFLNDRSHFDFGSSDVWIMAHSYCFDFSVWEMYGALLFGGKLIIPDRKDVRDISAFVRLVSQNKVTVLNQTPGAFYKFIDTVHESRNGIALNLRYVIFGGDKLNPSKLGRWISKYPAAKVKLINMYGITETTIHVTYHQITDQEIQLSDGSSNVGNPLPETKVYILDPNMEITPTGVFGEIYVAGSGLSRGYLNRPDLTAERFLENPYVCSEIIYRSGDIGRWLYDGTLEYLDRSDSQVQIRGYRVEMNEIELRLRQYQGIKDTVVVAVEKEGTKELAAYLVSDDELKIERLKSHLASWLPDYMIPSFYIQIEKIPLTPNGKVDRKSLPAAIQNISTGALFENPANDIEEKLLVLWQEVLSTESISIHDNFFDLGGNSILLVKLHSRINGIYPDILELTDLFSKSRITEQAEFIAQRISGKPEEVSLFNDKARTISDYHDIAIIGMAARIGDCETPEEFWQDLCLGIDFIGEIPESRIPDIKELCKRHNFDPDSVKFRELCYIPEVDKFDHGFFKLSPSEAALIDPGQRLFMETAYHALEDAGYGGKKLWGSKTGVFLGASDNISEYAKYIDASDAKDLNQLLVAQTPSILASRLSYHLNLKGPALLVDTACSSSLVAVHLAIQSLRDGKIDTAIVGSVKLHLLPVDSGSRLEIDSSDARGHSFDDSANGTGGGEGAIAILIKPLTTALRDKDSIYAVIKGSEINQDGSSIGITAPDADAQADAIEKAWLDSGVDPQSVSFIETHGTATKLGDPIEIDGITKAYKRYTSDTGICAIGAVKANIGHLDTAAGLAGLVKAVLSLKHRKLTPLAHFKTPNRNIKFEDSAAYINRDLADWQHDGTPLRCGVSSFGLSGTNCHIVLEEAPEPEVKSVDGKKRNILVLSSRSKDGLLNYAKKIRHSIYLNTAADPQNICYTLATGRSHHSFRLAIIFEAPEELIQKLSLFIDNDPYTPATEAIYCQYSKAVASNKKNLAFGEITEAELRDLSNQINEDLYKSERSSEKIIQLAEAYIKGADIEWSDYYSNSSPSKISLPGYPFERKRCWVNLVAKETIHESINSAYGKKFENVFLGNCIVDTPNLAVYVNKFDKSTWLLNEHRILNQPTLVGVAYLQMAYEAGRNHLGNDHLIFDNFYLLQPLALEEEAVLEVLSSINKSGDNHLSVEIQSKSKEDSWNTYAKFQIALSNKSIPDRIDLEEIKKRLPNSRDVVYNGDRVTNQEIVQVSNKWNCLNKIYWNETDYLAELSVPPDDSALADTYHLYPPMIDAALSYAIDEAGFLPYSFGTVTVRRKASGKIFSYIRRGKSDSSETRSFDITLTDDSGYLIASFQDFTLKRIAFQRPANNFHELIWKPFPLKKEVQSAKSDCILLYNSACNQQLVNSIISKTGIVGYEVIHNNFEELFSGTNFNNPFKIIFVLPSVSLLAVKDEIDLETALDRTLYSAFHLAKFLSLKASPKIDLLFVGENVSEVNGGKTALNSLNYSVSGIGQVLQRENPTINCRFLDIDEFTSEDDVLDELNYGFTDSYYYRSYRNAQRFIREIKPVKLEDRAATNITYQDGGVYVITGGTGGIGLELGYYFSKQAKIKLVLINRTELPPREKWDEIVQGRKDPKLCRKLEKLAEIEKEAVEVYLITADLTEFSIVKSTIEKIENEIGRICGVVHAAGVPGGGFIFNKEFADFQNVVKAKIHSTIYLSQILKNRKPDFFVMTSALTAILPTSGQSDYTAANLFMDGFSAELNHLGFNAQSINLTSWKETGMAYDFGVTEDGIFKSITTEQGISAIGQIIQKRIGSVILGEPDLTFLDSPDNLPFYLDEKLHSPKKQMQKKAESHEVFQEVLLKGKDDETYSEFEIAVAQVWGNVLGYEEISIADNYYDLGGDSIHAIKINSLLEKKLKIQVTISELFNHLTIAELSEYLESKNRSLDNDQEKESDSYEIVPAAKSNYYPVSSAQRRLFILDQLTKDKLSYHIPEIWNIKGTLRVDDFIAAFGKMINHQEILRTSFELVEDMPVQIVHETVDFDIPVFAMNEQDARNHILGFIQPFDLKKAPLFRAEIIELSPDNHLILFDAHHIIIDAFSMEILKKELFSYYEGKELDPLTIQYKDYAIWQNTYFKSEVANDKKSYWIDQFSGAIPVINLPTDFPRANNQSAEAGTFTLCIDERLTAEIKKMSANQGISTFMILLATYNIVLNKYTGQDDIIIGVTTIGRNNENLSGLLGMFVNNLPIRTFPSGDITVAAFLNEVKETAIKAFANQDYPFDELIENLNISRDLNRSPLFDVVFSYMNFELSEFKNGELRVSDYRAETIFSSEYDLMLYGLEAEDKIYITIKYKKSLFRKESIERFACHFSKTVETILGNSELKIGDLDILLPDELTRLESYNSYYPKITGQTDSIEFIRRGLTENQDKTALLFKDKKTTYRELNEKANKLANYLQQDCAVKPNDLIAIMVERTEAMVVAMLGVLKSGAAYVGIDTSYPQKRIEYIWNDSKAKLLITEKGDIQNEVLSQIPDSKIVDIHDELIELHSADEPVRQHTLEDLAYIIYTSGSTGLPKGVEITHKNLAVFLQWCAIEFKNSAFDIIYASTSYCFDISIFETFYALSAGKTIRILKSALEIPAYLAKDKNILINTVPSLVLAIADDLHDSAFRNITAINLAGEQIPQSLIDSFDCDRLEVRNLYGPSEDTTYSTIYRFSNTNKNVLIGRPISNTQIYLVDKNFKLVSPGHVGEICIAGDGLARGYFNKENLTKEKFLPNPFGEGRIYRTGDLGKWTDTGDLECLGRIDSQVKIRGYRIELGEIEANIKSYPGIENALVVAVEKGASKDIAAYFVAHEEIDLTDLKNHLGRIMPAFMIPMYFVRIEKIPLTPNGKVDRKALPDPEPDTRQSGSVESEELNPVEMSLSGIWRRVLEIENLSKHDNFFNVGGHSLKALRLLSQINREFNRTFQLSDIFEFPTIAQFAIILGKTSESNFTELTQLNKADYYDVSHAQRRLWILNRMEKVSIAYNIPMVYQVKSDLNIEALQNAFHAIICKYESLRTCFVEIDGEPKQRIQDQFEFEIAVFEITGSQNLIENSKELVKKAITTPFDLEKAPLIKVSLLRQSATEECLLLINVHHIIMDEWSIDIMINDLALFYDHFAGRSIIRDQRIFLPSPIQYKEYAHWHNHMLSTDEKGTNQHKNFWFELFKEPVQCLNLPLDFPRPKTQTFEGETVSFQLPELLTSGLKRICAENDSTLFITTLALLHILFSKYTKQEDIVIGTPIANRDHQNIQDQIGFFLNTLALRNKSESTESFKSFLTRVKKNTVTAFSHQVYPFDLLVDELQLPRDLSRTPLFDVMLISQTAAEKKSNGFSSLDMSSVEFDYPVSKFDLSISYFEEQDSVNYFFEYNTALFRKERIENMFNHFATLLASIIANDEKPISQLTMISGQERAELLNLSTGNIRTLNHQSIVGLIEKQANEFPDHTAVIFKRETISYLRLNSRANQFSRLLTDSEKVKPGDFICVMLDRTEWSVITMLAVLKAGAVFVPVDPNYPPKRIEYILKDSGGKILITTDNYGKLYQSAGMNIVTIDRLEECLDGYSVANPDICATAADNSTAYVIYTSGSTGEPKGVLGTHRCLINLVEWQSELVEGGLKTLQFAPHSFDVSIQEILFSLATAGTLFMIENDTRYKMTLISEMIEKEEIELLTMPYSALNLFLGEVENIGQLKSLKHVITSGEQPYINTYLEKLLKTFPAIKFHNQYGPSETHVVSSFTVSGKDDPLPGKIPIGKPINNTQLYILDKDKELVPRGIAGDLYIGGYNVANGYINKPDLTDKRFIQNPFSEGLIYESGDMALWNSAGDLEFLGRDDGQVKVRGYRIELGEIESCLLSHPDIREAVVKIIDDQGDKEIAAYFTTVPEKEIPDLAEFMAATLPGYMIPGYFVKLTTFPYTPSGKIDVRNLPNPDQNDKTTSEVYVEPSGETEIIIADVWKQVLNRELIGANDDFFAIGGNSIKAIQVMSKVQKRLGKKTYLNLIFKQPTIAKMAAIILNTDLQLKNMETDILLLNQEHEKKIFFLPPGIGYSFAYMAYSKFFDDWSVYGINFIESDDPAESVADLICDTQKEGDFYLFGHSAGGNMAFDVALTLQKRGRRMGGIILLDSYRQLEIIDWSPDEYLNDAILYIEQNHAEFLDEEIKDAALRKIVSYRKYLNARTESELLDCPIIQIEATDLITDFKHNISRSEWSKLTRHFETYTGWGGHMDMLKQPNMEKNALLTKELLDKLNQLNS